MKKYIFKLRLLPTILFTAVVILIVKAHSYSADLGDMPDIPINSTTELWDMFSYGKSAAIFAITIYAIVSMAYLLLVGKIKIKKTAIYIPMLVYTVGVIASYITSEYKYIAWAGGVGRFEGTRTILCYMFMLFYTINVVEELRDALTIIVCTLFSVFITCSIGITQLLKHDFFLTDTANAIVAGTEGLSINPAFRSGQVYQTVANMNYVGMYLALIIPLLVYAIYFLLSKENRLSLTNYGIYNKKRQIMVGTLCLLLLMIVLNIIGADSLGGVLGICSGLAILLYEFLEKKWQRILLISATLICLVGTLSFVYVKGIDDHNNTGHKQIDFIETGMNYINMSVDGEVISIIYDSLAEDCYLEDAAGKSIATFWFADEEGILQVDDGRFAGKIRLIPFKDINGCACILVDVMDNEWESFGFTFYEEGAKYLNPFGREVSLSKVDSLGFKGHLSAGSGRGYVWSRTIPLLRERIILGSGADTFMLLFPQNDYAGKYTSGTALNITFSKPHSLYLNMAVGTGLLSMIAFLTMVIMVLWKAFHLGKDKLYIKVLAAGIVGFLIAGIFNDSTVSIMPMFYGLLGTLAGLVNCNVIEG